MSYPQLGDDQSADTAAYWALHDAAVAAANARAYGSPQQAAAARGGFNAAAASNAARVVSQEQADTAPGFLEQLQAALTGAGKIALLGLAGVAAIAYGPTLLRMAGRRRRAA